MYRIVGLCLFASQCVFADVVDFDKQQIKERIKPVGSVHLEQQQKTAQPAVAEEKKPVQQEPGQATYEQYCSTCHKTGLAGAPKFRDAADWKSRLENKNIDQLVASAIKGINAMPPKGTCQECDEQAIKNAVQYMLPK